MQNIYGIIFIITSIVLAVWGDIPPTAAPKSLYDRLVKYSSLKCPYLKTTKLLDPKPAFLDECSNYDDIKSIKMFSYQTTTNVLCLLYYNNYISLCNVMGNTIYFNNTVIDNLLKGFALENTCKYLQNSKLIADLEDKGNIVTKMWNKCDFVCGSEDGVLPICSLAAVSLNLTERLQKYKSAMEATRNVQPKGSAHEKQTIPKSKDLDPQPDAAKDIEHNNKETINVKQEKSLSSHAGENLAHSIPSSANKQLLNVSQEEQSKINSHSAEQIPADGVNSNMDKTMKKTVIPVVADTKTDEKLSGEEKPLGDEKSPTNDAEGSKSKTIDNPIEPQTVVQASVPKNGGNAEDQTSKPTTDVTKPNTSATAAQENKLEDENIDIDNNSREEMEPQPNDAQNIEEDSMEEEEPSFREPQKIAEKIKQNAKPKETDEDAMLPAYNNSNSDEEDSFFFIYFMMVCAVFILGYVGYHNKQKVLALVIEGRRGRRGSRRGRPNSANYHKLDSNLEEAVTSACNKNTTNIIY